MAFDRATHQKGVRHRDEGRPRRSWLLVSVLLPPAEGVGIDDAELRDKLVAATRISANWGNMCRARVTSGSHRRTIQNRSDFECGRKDRRSASVNGIADCFRTIADSGMVGYKKPHRRFLKRLCEQMRASPEAAFMSGDLYSVDYAGATQAGMQAMMLDVAGAYRRTACPGCNRWRNSERVLLD